MKPIDKKRLITNIQRIQQTVQASEKVLGKLKSIRVPKIAFENWVKQIALKGKIRYNLLAYSST